MAGAAMYELVRVGTDNLIGEIIRLEGDSATIQVIHGLSARKPRRGAACASRHDLGDAPAPRRDRRALAELGGAARARACGKVRTAAAAAAPGARRRHRQAQIIALKLPRDRRRPAVLRGDRRPDRGRRGAPHQEGGRPRERLAPGASPLALGAAPRLAERREGQPARGPSWAAGMPLTTPHATPLRRAAQPLSVELGPGILGNIFDGIQRPLKTIAVESGDCFIPRGVAVPALDPSKQWEFNPTSFKASRRRRRGLQRLRLRPAAGPVLPSGRSRPRRRAAAAGGRSRIPRRMLRQLCLPRRWATGSRAATSTAWCTRTR